MSKHRILIIGGGFGGTKVALELSQHPEFEVTLVSDRPDFRYYPSLYKTATGGRRDISSVPLTEIFKNRPIHSIISRAISMDRASKTITLTDNQVLPFDSLVLALGMQTNYFNIKGLDKFSYGIKTIDEAEKLKRHLHEQVIDDKHLDLNYVIVGGGATGLELAGALPSYLKYIAKKHSIKHSAIRVSLVEAAPRLVPKMPKDFSKTIARHLRKTGVKLYLDTAVLAETAETLTLDDKKLHSETVIWTAGVTNNPFYTDNNFQINKQGKVRVNQFLQAEQDIYVIGDNTDTPYSGTAQTALYDGKYIANSLIRVVKGGEDMPPYVAKKPIYVLPAGDKWAAVLWGKVRIYGRMGYALRRAADLIAYHDYEPWRIATKRWVAEDDREEFCPICKNI